MTGIHITSIVPPEQGWPIAMHCPICKTTVFMLSTWAIKPTEGDYFLMRETCADEKLSAIHNMSMATDKMMNDFMKYPPKSKFMFQPTNPMPPPYLGSWIEFEQEMPIEEAKKRWPENFKEKND